MLFFENMGNCRQLRVQEKSFELQSCHGTTELICFVSKEIFCFTFKVLFVVPLSVEQLSKVKMKDVLLMSFQY